MLNNITETALPQSLNEVRNLLQTQIFGSHHTKGFNSYSQSILSRLNKCHTAAIGVHYLKCDKTNCGHVIEQYHSCGDRNCPNCGGQKRAQWLQDRMSELLPTTYFHIVFTLPQELRSLVMGNRVVLYNLIFESAHHTLNMLSNDATYLGGKPGIISILHTNGQDLSFHPHIHCIVSGGGIDTTGNWVKEKRSNGSFLFPRRAMEKIYKAYFLKRLQQLIAAKKIQIKDESILQETIKQVGCKKWNVYAKAPFGGPAQILEYLGRYTHKTAITAHRITAITQHSITFKYKDYAEGNSSKTMTLSHAEFLRRFEQHILPKGFVKIRHGGYLAHNGKKERIASMHKKLGLPAPTPKIIIPIEIQLFIMAGHDYTLCPKCKEGHLKIESSYKYFNGEMVNVKDLAQRKIDNKGSFIKRRRPTNTTEL
jgi:Putative transposase/Transposase zinc-binding domain